MRRCFLTQIYKITQIIYNKKSNLRNLINLRAIKSSNLSKIKKGQKALQILSIKVTLKSSLKHQ